MLEYLNHLNLLNKNNSGFKRGDSPVNQLLYITDKIHCGFEIHLDNLLAFLDVKAAFDWVWHDGLIYKVSCLGVKGHLLKWLSNYLRERSQKVVLKGTSSLLQRITAGVPKALYWVFSFKKFLCMILDFTLNQKVIFC